MWPTPVNPQLGVHVAQNIRGLKKSGVSVDVLHFNRPENGVKVYRNIGRRIRNRTRQHQYDLLHVLYGGIMARRVVQEARSLPVVVSFCGSDLLGEGRGNLLRRLMGNMGVRASRQAVRCADAVIVKSENLRQALPHSTEHSRIRIIPNGVDLARFRPIDPPMCRRKLGWSRRLFHVLHSSNNGHPVKRPELARAAMEVLRMTGIDGELHYLHKVPHEEVPFWLNAADVVLMTSAHEGSPNIVKEALACNRPVVSVDVGDVRERIENIRGCFLSDPQPRALADRLRDVHFGLRTVAGRQVVSKLSIEATSQRIVECYREVIERSACPARTNKTSAYATILRRPGANLQMQQIAVSRNEVNRCLHELDAIP